MSEEQLSRKKPISRDALIGFLAVRCHRLDGSEYIWVRALSYSWEMFNDDDSELEKEEPIGVLPAPPKSYVVYGLFPAPEKPDRYPEDGEWKEIGYEFEGADHPDWLGVLREKRERVK